MKAAKKTLPYARKEINITLSDENRFWNKVDKSGGPNACWMWASDKYSTGYGCFYLAGKKVKAHRVAWVSTYGSIPIISSYHGLCVCHRCDNPGCCNPSHLFLGTNADNVADRETKHRNTPGEANTSARLTNTQAIEILSLYAVGNMSHEDIARQFGVSSNTISRITNRKGWKHLPFAAVKPVNRVFKKAKPVCGEMNVSSKLTNAQVINIRSSYRAGTTNLTQLGRQFGVNPSTIWEITQHRSWKHIIDPTHPLHDIW